MKVSYSLYLIIQASFDVFIEDACSPSANIDHMKSDKTPTQNTNNPHESDQCNGKP